MSKIQTGEEIIEECERGARADFTFYPTGYHFLRNKIEKAVVVPEETWQRIEKMLFFENVLEGDVLIPQAKWEKIKTLVTELERGKDLLGGTSCLETAGSYMMRVEKIVESLKKELALKSKFISKEMEESHNPEETSFARGEKR